MGTHQEIFVVKMGKPSMSKQDQAIFGHFSHHINAAPVVWVIAGVAFFIQALAGSHLIGHDYGHDSDELYVMALSRHPASGYVDAPPLLPWVLVLTRLTAGNALRAIHTISALLYADTILLTGCMARLSAQTTNAI